MPHIKSPGQALVIYNPSSGTASDIDLCLGSIVHRLCERMNMVVTVRPTTPALSGIELLRTVTEPLDLVVVAGGDGTIRLVLGALSEQKSRVPVGLVPLGTGNQLARNLKIYEENLLTDPLEDALSVISHGRHTRIDLGRMNGEYFCVAAGAGPLSDAVVIPSAADKANFKMFAYVGSLIQNFAMPPVVFRVKTGPDDFNVSASGIFVTNVADYGVGTLSDTAQLNDGLLDLCILNPAEVEDYLGMGFRMVTGFLGGEAAYYIKKVKDVSLDVVPVESPLSDLQTIAHGIRNVLKGKAEITPPVYKEVIAMIDGDACGTTPMHIDVVPDAVTVLTPRKK
jgi:diacylglycerol kinase (ATP)